MKRYQMPRLDSKFMVIALSVLILLYFIVLPLAVLIIDSVVVDGHLDVSSYLTGYGQEGPDQYGENLNSRHDSFRPDNLSLGLAYRPNGFAGTKKVPNHPCCQLYDSPLCWGHCLDAAS
mgnify:CR=1 FL=1